MALAGPSFLLVPVNDRAQNATLEEANGPYWYPLEDGTCALNIQFAAETSEVTLGSAGTDIYLPEAKGAEISRKHCAFAYERITGAIVLYDKSRKHTTEVFDIDEDRVVSISKPAYSVVVSKGFNRRIAVGREKYYQFELRWHSDVIDEYLQAGRNTTFGPWGCKEYRYVKGEDLGAGAFGAVWKAVDVRDGKAMAVKRFHTLEGRRRIYAHREINNLLKIKNADSIRHEHILEIFDAEYDPKERWIEMFMPLKEGSLKTLGRLGVDLTNVPMTVLYQMLLALDCTASHGIVHRDLKPDNILYETRYTEDGTAYYHFWLADFGLSHDAAEARTRAGTEPFMAPEVLKKAKQTTKMDIWSLFATIVWLYDVDNFRVECWRTDHIHDWLVSIAKRPRFANIAKMGRLDPLKRLSAKELIKAPNTFIELPDDTPTASESAGVDDVTDQIDQMNLAPAVSQYDQGYGQYPESSYQYPAATTYPNTGYPAAAAAGGEWTGANYSYNVGDSSAQGYAKPRGGRYETPATYEEQYAEGDYYSHGVMGRDYNAASGAYGADPQQQAYHQQPSRVKEKGKEKQSRSRR